MKSIKDKVTLNQLIDIYRGSASKTCLKFSTLSAYGKAQDQSKGEVERILQNMCVQGLLSQYCHSNPMGYVSSYIRVGSEARKLDFPQFQFLLTVNSSSQEISSFVKEKKGRKRKSCEGEAICVPPEAQAKKPRRRSKRNETGGSNMRDDIDCESEVYEPEESECEGSLDIVELGQKDVASNSSAAKIQEDNSKTQKTQVECFNALKKARQSLCLKNQCQSASVATDVLLAKIAKEMPSSLTELAKVKGMAERQIISYGSDFLEIVNKFKKFQDGNK